VDDKIAPTSLKKSRSC